MYNDTFLTETKKIIGLIAEKNSETAVVFEKYLQLIKDIGPFSLQTWPLLFRSSVYDLGRMFDHYDAGNFLRKIQEAKIICPQSSEIYDFVYSEIIWNFFEQDTTYNKEELHSFIRQYPGNPEFHHTYSHFLEKNNNFDKALFEVKTALKIEPDNNVFLTTYIYRIKTYFDYLILKGQIEQAEKLLNEQEPLMKEYQMLRHFGANNVLSSLKDRLKDHKAIQQRIIYFEKDIENRIQVEQRRLIEILGIFSAILGFILTNITIGISNLNIHNMLILMLGMAMVLIIFSISISYLFGRKYRYAGFFHFLQNAKFWAGLLFLLILLLLIFYIK